MLYQIEILQVLVQYRTRDHLKWHQKNVWTCPYFFYWLLKSDLILRVKLAILSLKTIRIVIAVVHSGICCLTKSLFTGDNFMSKSILWFWKFIYNNLRSSRFFKVNIIWLDFTLRCIIFFWIQCVKSVQIRSFYLENTDQK